MANTKLTDEQLKKVQDLNQTFLQIKVKIADAEIQKSKSIAALDATQEEFSKLEKELIEIYGDNATIDLRSGEVKMPEEEKEKKDGKNK